MYSSPYAKAITCSLTASQDRARRLQVGGILQTHSSPGADYASNRRPLFTACLIAATNPKTSCLLLTYNKRLKEETRQRVTNWKLGNLSVDSFHAAGVRYFTGRCKVDEGLVEVVRSAMQPCQNVDDLQYGIIIIDETQDVTPLLFAFLQHLCRCILANRGQKPFRLVCVGDVRQAIFGFRMADPRFLRLADQCMPAYSLRSWVQCELSTSYRVTPPMAAFINEAMLGGRGRMISAKDPSGDHAPVWLWTGKPWSIMSCIAGRIADKIRRGIWKAGEIMVLGTCTGTSRGAHVPG